MKKNKLTVEMCILNVPVVKKFVEYFGKEITENNATEFRVVFSDKEKGIGYIHPINKNGTTLDFDLSKEIEIDD